MNMNIFEAVWEARTTLIWGFYSDRPHPTIFNPTEPTFVEWLREILRAHTECHTRPILWDGEYMQLTRFGWNCLWPDEDPEALARAGCVVVWKGSGSGEGEQ